MYKKLLLVAAFAVVIGGMVGVSSAEAKKEKPEEKKVTICHRTNSATNPYVQETVSVNALNGGGHDDHTLHTGPLASSFAVATTLKNAHTDWGDVIPPFIQNNVSYPGLNWSAEGQAMYANECAYTTPPTALIDYDLVCDVDKQKAIITFTNTGNADGSVTVNGSVTAVSIGNTAVEVPTAETGTQITIIIAGNTVFDQLVTCEPGRGSVGGETPTASSTPTAQVASLPFTAGDNTQALALVASAVAAITAIVGTVVKTAFLKQ
jgi:hypothetical protein